MQEEARKKYRKIISQMEKSYSESGAEEQLVEVLRAGVAREFKVELTADCTMEEALREYHEQCARDFLGTQAYCGQLGFIEKVNELLYSIAFISRREYVRLCEVLARERASPVNHWLEDIAYLRSSESQWEFRFEFLTRYCDLEEAAAEELLEEGSAGAAGQLREHY